MEEKGCEIGCFGVAILLVILLSMGTGGEILWLVLPLALAIQLTLNE
jgi:hypothetical protein